MSIYVLTWNIKAGQNPEGRYPKPKTGNLDKIALEIYRSRASIICMQEVDAFTRRSGGVHQAEYITAKLVQITRKKWYYNYKASIIMHPGYYGNAVISRFPLTAALKVSLNNVYGTEPRSFLLSRVDLDSTCVYAGTFHLGLNGDQAVHARRIKAELKYRGYLDKKLVTGGDLNDTSSSEAYNIMLHTGFPMLDSGPAVVHTFKHKKIDFLFAQNISVDIKKSRVLNVDISDHRPVLSCIYT